MFHWLKQLPCLPSKQQRVRQSQRGGSRWEELSRSQDEVERSGAVGRHGFLRGRRFCPALQDLYRVQALKTTTAAQNCFVSPACCVTTQHLLGCRKLRPRNRGSCQSCLILSPDPLTVWMCRRSGLPCAQDRVQFSRKSNLQNPRASGSWHIIHMRTRPGRGRDKLQVMSFLWSS